MTTLYLGVLDVGYSGEEGAKTTGEVAEILEEKYHPMRVFYELNEDFIGDELVNQVAGAIETVAMGGPAVINFQPAMGKIEDRFRMFLDMGELERVLPKSQHSQAAAKGVSHRKKHPYAQANKSRPALIDTGLYQASFRAWID